MAVRNKRCRNCPQKEAGKAPVPAATQPQQSLAITSESEGVRLWKHVLFGTSTCVGMIEGYQVLKMPGNPLEALLSLRNRLNELISKYEAKPNATDPAAERPTLGRPTLGGDTKGAIRDRSRLDP